MSTADSRDGFATHAARAAAERLPLPIIGRAGLVIALATYGLVIATFVREEWAGDAWWFLLYGAGHVAGWWFTRPRRNAAFAYTLFAAIQWIQLAVYALFWLVAFEPSRYGWPGDPPVDLLLLTMIAFFVFGPALGIAAALVARRGWVFLLAQWGGPAAWALFG